VSEDLSPAEFSDRLQRALVRSIPGVRSLSHCERLTAGASQETYAIVVDGDAGERKLALRRAPDGPALDGSLGPDLEAKLIRLAREAGVPEPEVFHVLTPEDELGRGFVMEWISGETLGSRIVKLDTLAKVRPKLARQCGRILAQIHAIDLDASGLRDDLRHSQAEEEVHLMWDRYKALETPMPMIDFCARWLLENRPAETQPCLVHGEFRNGNLIIDPTGIRAVLDWEIAHIGDPAQDLGWLCENSWRFSRPDLPVGGFGSFEDLVAAYEEESGTQVDPDRVRYWMVYGGFWWSVSTLRMTDIARQGMDPSIERLTIGRRSSEAQIDCANLLIPGPVSLPESHKTQSTLDMPRADELLQRSREFLRDSVMPETQGRTSFLARVTGNALDIVLREFELGPATRQAEQIGLESVLGKSGEVEALRWELVDALRSGVMPLNTPGLADHLRNSVAAQIAIDQPRYTGLRTALEGSNRNAFPNS